MPLHNYSTDSIFGPASEAAQALYFTQESDTLPSHKGKSGILVPYHICRIFVRARRQGYWHVAAILFASAKYLIRVWKSEIVAHSLTSNF